MRLGTEPEGKATVVTNTMDNVRPLPHPTPYHLRPSARAWVPAPKRLVSPHAQPRDNRTASALRFTLSHKVRILRARDDCWRAPLRPRAIRFRAHRRVKPPSIRTGTVNRKPWVPSSASANVRHGQAIFYLLKVFDHRAAYLRDRPTLILAKVVCNLRNYYLQDQESTVDLIQTYFNPKSWDEPWSAEAVRLMWEGVAPFTPALGLLDEKAIAMQKAQFLENEVVDLIAWTEPGGRVLDKDLEQVFREWNPELEIEFKGNLFSRAVKAVTGLSKFYSNSKGYWVGFHLPTAEELAIREGKVA